MSFWWVFAAGLVAVLAVVLCWISWRWLASSWEELDEDQLDAKLSRHSGQHHALGRWLRMREWFAPKSRQLTYRRDKLGRFRKINRW